MKEMAISTVKLLLVLFVLSWPGSVSAQNQLVPNFWHPGETLTKPDIGSVTRLRFLTTTDFPPFNFIDRRKRLTGFHVDLARAICAELDILDKCEIQALPWEELEGALERGEGEAIIAGLQITPQARTKFEFSRSYLHIPARFAVRTADSRIGPIEATLREGVTALVAGSNYEKWFRQAFEDAETKSFPTRREAFAALKDGEVKTVFSDAVSLAFWLTSRDSEDCCSFAGSAYFSPVAFGHGLAIAFSRERRDLAQAADFALKQINDKGIFAELYLRYFPLGLY